MVPIFEPVNYEGSDAILDFATGVCATTALNATTLHPPLSQTEDVPPPSPQVPLPPETNEVLTNLVNLLANRAIGLNVWRRIKKNF